MLTFLGLRIEQFTFMTENYFSIQNWKQNENSFGATGRSDKIVFVIYSKVSFTIINASDFVNAFIKLNISHKILGQVFLAPSFPA